MILLFFLVKENVSQQTNLHQLNKIKVKMFILACLAQSPVRQGCLFSSEKIPTGLPFHTVIP